MCSSDLEVHEGAHGVGPLWYRVGVATDSGVQWGDSHQYDTGIKPAVAIDGTTVVETHQEGRGVGPIDYKIGFVDAATKTIAWKDDHRFATGMAPTVSDRGGYVRVAYQESEGVGPMDFAVGKITLFLCWPHCGSYWGVEWSGVYHDANGISPSLAGYSEPTSSSIPNWRGFIEVHQGSELSDTWDWEHADLPLSPLVK